jgi:hypothetical protein
MRWNISQYMKVTQNFIYIKAEIHEVKKRKHFVFKQFDALGDDTFWTGFRPVSDKGRNKV